MSDPNVYEVDRIQPEDDYIVKVGVDYGEVSLEVGGRKVTLNATEYEELSHLLVQAAWQAAANSERMRQEADGG